MKFEGRTFFAVWIAFILLVGGCQKNPAEAEVESLSYAWPESPPSAQGMDESRLDSLEKAIERNSFIDSFLLIKNGYLVFEKYYNGFDLDTYHAIFSGTKSFLSALVGIALGQGLFENLDQLMIDFLPEYKTKYHDERYGDITLRHLLNMTSGIPTPQLGDILPDQDVIEGLLNLPLVNTPGEAFLYSNGAPHLLSKVFSNVAGENAYSFAQKYLCDPAGFTISRWITDNQGTSYGAEGIGITPRDLARFGYLYLREGMLDGQQIIPYEWVHEILDALNDSGFQWQWGDYGYKDLWWIEKVGSARAFTASGWGGQLMMGFPELDLLIVTTSRTPKLPTEASAQNRTFYDLIITHVLPSILSN